MRLTLYSDYAIRLLIHLAVHDDRLHSIAAIARAFRVSQNHLMKIASDLARAGYITAVRGRSGGLQLARPAAGIRLGDVVRHTEDGFTLVDCPSCAIATACGVTPVLGEALGAFMAVLDRYTLADITRKRRPLRDLLSGLPPPAARTSVKRSRRLPI